MATNYFLVSHQMKTMVFCGVSTGMGGIRGPVGDEARIFGAYIAIPEHQGAVLLSEHALEGFDDREYVEWTDENHARLYEKATNEKLYQEEPED